MQNPLQSAQEKTAFEMGLYGYPYVRAPKKGRKAWISVFSSRHPPPAQPQASPHLQDGATGEPGPQQLPGLSAAPGKTRIRQHFQNWLPVSQSAHPRARASTPGCNLLRAPHGVLSLPSVGGCGAHCPVKESHPNTDVETERTIPASHGASSAQRAALWPLPSAPSRLPETVVGCVGVCVCVFPDRKKIMDIRLYKRCMLRSPEWLF